MSITRRGLGVGALGAGALAAIAPRALAYTTAPWLRTETANFIIYSGSSEARVHDLADNLEAYDALLTHITGAAAARSPLKLEVFLFRVPSAFYEAFGSVAPSVLGFYKGDAEILASVAQDRSSQGLDAQVILFHEYAHHFMFAHFANAYPAWYVEGFAELASTTAFEPTRTVIGRASPARTDTLSRGSWLPLQRLLALRPSDITTGDEEDKFYAQSWLLAHYIFMTPGMDAKFRDYVAAWRQGGDPIAIFPDKFGKSIADFESDVRQHYQQGVHAIGLPRTGATAHAAATVTPMPDSTNDLLALSIRLRGGVSSEKAPALLQLVHDRVTAPPQDAFAFMTLARAEAKIGDRARARALLEPYLETHAGDFEAQYLLGLTYLRDAEDAEGDAKTAALTQARHHFVAAYRQNENYVPALFHYAETFDGVMMTHEQMENTTNVALLAHQLAPQVSEIGFLTAQWLMNLDRPREAIPILRAMAYDPHGGSGAKQALDLLRQAETAAGLTPAPEQAPAAQH
ncbi:MAG: hypothetical protein QM759_12875 [Terricaulis sp.]